MENDPKLRIYPTLVIGLGGVGTNVVRLAKRRYLRTWNSNLRRRRAQAHQQGLPVATLTDLDDLPPVLQLMAVDTEPNTEHLGYEPLYYDEYAFLGNFDATKLVNHKANHRWLQKWWRWPADEIAPGYVHTGAKQLRPIGRLAFFRNYVTFKEMLQRKLRAMPSITAKETAEENYVAVTNTPRVIYIVSSVCGGTGAGMLLDAAHVVRHYATDRSSGGEKATIIGILLMPSVFESPKTRMSALQRSRIQANAYAVLKELNYFQVTQKFQALYPTEPVSLPANPYKPFDYIYLLESDDEKGFSLSDKSDAEHMAAHMIALTTFSTLNTRVRARDDNITREIITVTADTRFQTRSFAYSTFGVSGLVMPRSALWRYFVAETTRWALLRLMPRPEDQESMTKADRVVRWQAYHNELIADIQQRFEDLTATSTIEELKELEKEISKSEGRWSEFEALVDGMVKKYINALKGTELPSGLAGLRNVLRWIAEEESSSEVGYLARPEAFRIEEVRNPGPLNTVRSAVAPLFLVPASLQRRWRDAHARYEEYEKQGALWRQVVTKLQDRANRWINQINTWENDTNDLFARIGQEIDLAAMDIEPTLDTGDTETSTYYALETGAVSLDHLSIFREATRRLLNGRVVEQLVPALNDYLLAKLTGGLTPFVDVEDLVRGTLSNLDGLRDQVYREFDLRFLVYLQKDSPAPTNYRPTQFFDRSAAHAILDQDTNDNDGRRLESNFFLSIPKRLRTALDDEETQKGSLRVTSGNGSGAGAASSRNGNGSSRVQRIESTQGPEERDFKRVMQAKEHVEVIDGAEDERIDALRLNHGLPVQHLSSLRHLYEEYRGPRAEQGESQAEIDAMRDFTPRLLHLDPEYASIIPELYIDPSIASRIFPQRPAEAGAGHGQAAAGFAGQAPQDGQNRPPEEAPDPDQPPANRI